MKKRTQSNSSETLAHPNMLNYLALIHAVAHPGNLPEPTKHIRHYKQAGGLAVAS